MSRLALALCATLAPAAVLAGGSKEYLLIPMSLEISPGASATVIEPPHEVTIKADDCGITAMVGGASEFDTGAKSEYFTGTAYGSELEMQGSGHVSGFVMTLAIKAGARLSDFKVMEDSQTRSESNDGKYRIFKKVFCCVGRMSLGGERAVEHHTVRGKIMKPTRALVACRLAGAMGAACAASTGYLPMPLEQDVPEHGEVEVVESMSPVTFEVGDCGRLFTVIGDGADSKDEPAEHFGGTAYGRGLKAQGSGEISVFVMAHALEPGARLSGFCLLDSGQFCSKRVDGEGHTFRKYLAILR